MTEWDYLVVPRAERQEEATFNSFAAAHANRLSGIEVAPVVKKGPSLLKCDLE